MIVNLRMDLFEETIRTVEAEFCLSDAQRLPNSQLLVSTPFRVLDNGSTDGTQEVVRDLDKGRGILYKSPDGNTSPGRGENILVRELLKFEPEIVVCSDDDMRWKAGAKQKLQQFWQDAPEDVILVSGLLEPEWHWNTPREVVEAGGVRVLIRDSAPNAAWSFRAKDVETIFPLKENFGQDYEACVRLRKQGYRVGQLDLADHIGWGYSTNGNNAIEDARPLDRQYWNI